MLGSLREILGFRLRAIDDEIALVEDFYFDDFAWAIRHVVANTGRIHPAANVLLPPAHIEQPDWENMIVPVQLSADEVLRSPDIHSDLPVTLQRLKSSGKSDYFAPGGWAAKSGTSLSGDSCLRSLASIVGYTIQASDGAIGHVEDFIADTSDWIIKFMAIDTRDWVSGTKVVIPTESITKVDFVYSRVHVDLTKEQIKNRPELGRDIHLSLDGHVDDVGHSVTPLERID